MLLLAVPAAADAAPIHVKASDYVTNADLPKYTFIVNVDNASDRPGFEPTQSHSALVAQGDETNATVDLPAGRYLISVRAPDHKLWGKHIELPRDAGDVNVGLRPYPLPLGKLRIVVFHDNHWVNNALDEGEAGLGGFHITLEDQTHTLVGVDAHNVPLCGGDCVTGPDGFLEIHNLAPGTYFAYATPPGGTNWIQDSTFEGGFGVQVGVEEGSDGSGAPREGLWEPPDNRTGYWFGFVQPKDFPGGDTGNVQGTARNWVGWPPFDHLTMGDPVANPYVALSNMADDSQVYTGQGDGSGNFNIPNVPPGSYTLSIWDEQLNHIIRFLNVEVSAGQQINLGDVGVSRWFGWLSGDVYTDTNGNGIRDPGEPGIANTELDQRWRDGSVKESTATDPTGHYEYPTAEGGPLGKFFIGEVGFTRLFSTGPSLHNEYNPSQVTTVPQDQGGRLLTNQKVVEGHRSEVDWGKRPYPDGTPGQIVGIVYHATTRNELDARFAKHEDYEPGIPGVKVRLEGLGPDGKANTADDPVLNEFTTDGWQHPSGCNFFDSAGQPLPQLNQDIAPKCLEVPINGNQTKDGAFDGGYAFADMCPPNTDGSSSWPCADTAKVPLVAGHYITHVLMPQDAQNHDLYQIEKEEDVNVDNGPTFIPAIPPPACVGNQHIVTGAVARSPYEGKSMPLCDKREVVLQNKQNANSDFFVFSKNGISVPGRIVGLVSDDIFFDRDIKSIWYGEARTIGHIPIGIRDFSGRLLKTVETDLEGGYEIVLPSTETYNSPIPQGVSPGMYVVVVNDPGDKAHPNLNYNPDYLTAALAWDVWPGQTTQLDTPLDPISGVGCELPVGMPELLEVSRPFVRSSDSGTARRITIQGDFLGGPPTSSAPGRVTLSDPRPGQATRTLTVANGGIVSWTDRQIVINVPTTGGSFAAGPKQLLITGSNGQTSLNGITLHVLGSGYNPNVVSVAAATADPHAIQNAIDSAGAGSLLVLQPGVYRENVIMHKSVKLQGLGPGGIVGRTETGGRPPDDPRFNIQGTTIDGRFFADNKAAWDAKLGSLTFSGNQNVPGGADITVVARNGAFNNGLSSARIDGIGLTTGHGDGAGGIQVNAYARYLRMTNNVLQSNGGLFAGGIALGAPYVGDNHNDNIQIQYDRVLGNGALMRAGGIGIYNGADNYDISRDVVCSNFSVEYGAGISHWGRSPGGAIHDNQVYYNDSVDSGGGIAISQETPQPVNAQQVLGAGSGTVDVDRNLIQSNYAGDDGGGVFIRSAHKARINVRNNMIVDNGAADIGGAVALKDSSNVAIVNDTLAHNVSTGSSEGSDGNPHSAGLAAEANDPLFQATLPAGAPDFSNPVALFNDIFWQNEAFTINSTTVPPSLVSRGFMDFEVHGTFTPPLPARTFTPRYSLLTSAYGPPGQGNIVGQDPLFVQPFTLELAVAGSRLDPQRAAVTITGQDPPVGLTGDYHLTTASPAIDRGAAYSDFPAFKSPSSIGAPLVDYDGQFRPVFRSLRFFTPWDIGADEVPR